MKYLLKGEIMNLVVAKCTQCSKQLEVNPNNEASICSHCGTAFITKKAIYYHKMDNQSQIAHTNVQMNSEKPVDKYIRVATIFYEKNQDYKKSFELFRKAIEEAPDDYRGWYGILRIFTNDFQLTSGYFSSQPWWETAVTYFGEDATEKYANKNEAFLSELTEVYLRMDAVADEDIKVSLSGTWNSYAFVTRKSLYDVMEQYKLIQEEIAIHKKSYNDKLVELSKLKSELGTYKQRVKHGIGSVLPFLGFGIFTFAFYFLLVAVIWGIINQDPVLSSDPNAFYQITWVFIIFGGGVLFNITRNSNTKRKIEELTFAINKINDEGSLYLVNVHEPLLAKFNTYKDMI